MVHVFWDEPRLTYATEVIGWDLETGQPLPSVRLTVDGFALFNGVIDPSGRIIVDRERRIDAGTGKVLATLSVPDGYFPADPQFAAGGRFVAMWIYKVCRTHTADPEEVGVGVWETATGRQISRFSDVVGHPWQLTPDGRFLVTTGPNGMAVRDVNSGAPVLTHAPPPGRHRSSSWLGFLALSPDGRTAVTPGSGKCAAFIWDLTARK
jgi:WD40 repeat protein